MIPKDDFYIKTVASLLDGRHLTQESKILVVCGGKRDRDVFADLGFKDVVISNVDTRTPVTEYAPYDWSYQDAEDIGYEDGSFDFCIVHSGLHHCRSPHKGLLEMYRVASGGILVFEPLDNLMTRVGVRLGFGQEYEIGAVADNDYQFGGVRNTQIPNYVYRFTEREVVKTINSFAPVGNNRFSWFYAFRLPWDHFRMSRNKFRLAAVTAAYPFLLAFTWMFPRESNNFAFAILKPSLPLQVHPWLRAHEGEIGINREWVEKVYRKIN
jgi:SAM-dependent methyltransferase